MAENQVEEFPGQSYYPSAKVRVRVRFDSFGVTEDDPEPPAKRQNARKGAGKDEENTDLAVVAQDDGTLLLLAPEDDPNAFGGPLFTLEPERDFAVTLIPRSASLGRNGLRTADTLSVELKYFDFPLDPRTIRSASVEFFLGTVSAEDFERGIAGATRGADEEGEDPNSGEPLHLVPDEWVDASGVVRNNSRFQGFVDAWELTFADDEPIVRLDCTDVTRLVIDQPAPPKLTVSPDVDIDLAVAEYLANFPQFRGIGVKYLPGQPVGGVPRLGNVLSKTARKDDLGPAPTKGGGKMSVWDYLTDVAGYLGHNIRFEGSTIIIQRIRARFKEGLDIRPEDPFNRFDVDGVPLERRLFVYGRNIESITMKREFTAYAPKNIEVRCYHGKRKKTLVARFPQKDDRQTDEKTGGKAEQKYIVKWVQGIEDEETLRRIAQETYEALGRNELGVTFSTRNLASYGGGELDPDVLDMIPGDSIDVQITRDPEERFTVGNIEEELATEGRAEEYMKRLGYPEDLARQYATAFVNLGVTSRFIVRKMGIDWDVDDGVEIDVEAVNYVTVRADKDLPEGEEPSTDDAGDRDEATVP